MSATCLGDDPGLDGERLLADFADDVRRAYALGPPPLVGPALAEVLAGGRASPAPAHPPAAAVSERRGERRRARVGAGRARVALGAAVASLTFLGAGAAGALPGPAQAAFERTAGAVGIRLPPTSARGPAAAGGEQPHVTGRPSSARQAGDGATSSPPVPVPVGSDDPRPTARKLTGGSDAAEPTRPEPQFDVEMPDRGAGGRPGQHGPGESPAEKRPTSVPASPPAPADRAGSGPPGGVRPRYGPDWRQPSHWAPHARATGRGPDADRVPPGPYPSTPPRR